jgi:hypothetical protein
MSSKTEELGHSYKKGYSHITGFVSLEPISNNVGLHHLARRNIGTPVEVNSGIDGTARA